MCSFRGLQQVPGPKVFICLWRSVLYILQVLSWQSATQAKISPYTAGRKYSKPDNLTVCRVSLKFTLIHQRILQTYRMLPLRTTWRSNFKCFWFSRCATCLLAVDGWNWQVFHCLVLYVTASKLYWVCVSGGEVSLRQRRPRRFNFISYWYWRLQWMAIFCLSSNWGS